MTKKVIAIILVVAALGLTFGYAIAEAQSIGVGNAKITLPIIVGISTSGDGFSGISAHFSIIGQDGEITCLRGTQAGINHCDNLQTVRLAVDDLDEIWGPGDQANIGSITVSGTSGEVKTIYLTVVKADDDLGNSITSRFAPVEIQVMIP